MLLKIQIPAAFSLRSRFVWEYILISPCTKAVWREAEKDYDCNILKSNLFAWLETSTLHNCFLQKILYLIPSSWRGAGESWVLQQVCAAHTPEPEEREAGSKCTLICRAAFISAAERNRNGKGFLNTLCRAGVGGTGGSEHPGGAVGWRHHLAQWLHPRAALPALSEGSSSAALVPGLF